MYLSYQKGKIVGYTEEPQDLVLYNLDKVEETTDEYVLDGEQYVKVDEEYYTKKANTRKQTFYTQFIQTSLGNYRLQPKGYANAQQAMDVTNTMATALDGLTEQLTNLVIFYETPDFTKEEECTEEWLVAHQIKPNVMTLAEWQKFYLEFCQLYAMQQYKSEVVDDNTDTTTDNANTVHDELQSETN